MIRQASILMILLGALVVPGTAEAQCRGGGGPGAGGMQAPPGAEVGRQIQAALMNREALGLTEAQVSSLEELRDRMRQEMQGVREAMMEARAERREAARQGDRMDREARRTEMEERREWMRELHAPYREAFDETLTPEQRERLPELAPQRGGRGGPRGDAGWGGHRGRNGRSGGAAGAPPGLGGGAR